MSLVVACHQPNFLPWLGFFAKVARSDVFVLLDDVQFTQGAGKHNWTTRVRILGPNGPMWLSVPVRRSGLGKQRISELITDVPERWLPRLVRTLDQAYRKTTHAGATLPAILDTLGRCTSRRLCDTNIACIERICDLLGLETRLVRSSTIPILKSATERLVSLTRSLDGAVYLSGDGAQGYQEVQAFTSAGIGLRKLNFHPVAYQQRQAGEFVPGLSIIDALCNVGIEETRAMLQPTVPAE